MVDEADRGCRRDLLHVGGRRRSNRGSEADKMGGIATLAPMTMTVDQENLVRNGGKKLRAMSEKHATIWMDHGM